VCCRGFFSRPYIFCAYIIKQSFFLTLWTTSTGIQKLNDNRSPSRASMACLCRGRDVLDTEKVIQHVVFQAIESGTLLSRFLLDDELYSLFYHSSVGI
jgi:hypothetical protein